MVLFGAVVVNILVGAGQLESKSGKHSMYWFQLNNAQEECLVHNAQEECLVDRWCQCCAGRGDWNKKAVSIPCIGCNERLRSIATNP